MKVVEFKGVWEKYRIKFIQKKNVFWEEFWALEDINFETKKGEVLGVIGENGAGKTTLLKLIAGMLVPDRGEVYVQGKVSALMELGAGFNPEFTGRENIMLNAQVYGLDEETLAQQMEKIIEFADIGRFIDAPIKYYSQGMYMRLAFALAIYVEPDILLIDDILAVGDEEAQQKCIKKVFELKQAGKTIIVVSHDMNMIGRLCDQVILLERGKIIQKGPPQEVIPRYLEVVGDKKGIAILEKEKLRVVFNNGRITISYDGATLTKGMGGYVSFFVPHLNAWSSSFNLKWRIKNSLPDKIIVEGLHQDGTLAQSWVIGIEKDQLQWRVELKDDSVREPHIDLLLTPDYSRWSGLERDGGFGPFAHKSNWQEVGLDNYQDNIVGIRANLEKGNVPALSLEIENKDNQLKLLNTGYNQEARVVQSYLIEGNYISLRIKIFSDIGIFEEYIKQLLFRQQAELIHLHALRTISSGHLRLFADLEAKSLRLYYKDKELTKAGGLYSALNVSERWFLLKDAQWQIQKISEREMALTLYFELTSLSQIWTLICKDDNTLEIKIEIEVNKPIFFTHQDVRLELQDKYKNWLTVYEQGDFLVTQYINNIGPVRLKDNKVSQVVLGPEDREVCPELFFGASSQLDKRIISMYKKKEIDEKCICINSSLTIPKKEGLINPGKYVYFEGKIILGKGLAVVEEEPVLEGVVEFKRNDLRFVFDRGRSRMFWRQKELTTGLGAYTSVRSSGIWYDSYQAVWQVIKKEDNKIMVLGYWPYIPISQIWQLELIEKNLIYWKVEMEICEEVNLEIEQANLMLSSEYKTWLIPGVSKGELLDEYTQDYDILPFRFWYGKAPKEGIGVINRSLPCVFLKCNLENGCYRAIVENTDNLYRARLLQYQKSNTDKIAPKRYTYFEGVIRIESQG